MKKIIIVLFSCLIILLAMTGCGKKDSDVNNIKDDNFTISDTETSSFGPLLGYDNWGNELPTAQQTGVVSEKKRQVALFYFLWHESDKGPYLFSDVLSKNPDPKKPPTSKPWVGVGPYYWGEPFLGFYKSTDTWVMRKHVEMLTNADVDFLVFDATNSQAYIQQATKLMSILDEYRKDGWKTPQVVFYTNTDSNKRMLQIYANIYEKNLYPDTWYMIDGKPLIIGVEQGCSTTISDFFTLRSSQWPNVADVPNGFPWIDFKEKQSIYPDRNGKNKVISVSVAQNSSTTARFGDTIFYGMEGNRGRSYHNGSDNITEDSYKCGYNFQQQWDNAINSDADIAMITSWNEWTAGAWNNAASSPDKPIAIWDTITPEYSRDIEPMRSGFFDNYYMQMVANIRKFKGTEKTVIHTIKKTIDISGSFDQWSEIAVTYKDFASDAQNRNEIGIGRKKLINNSARNGFISSKVTQDNDNIYFYVQTQDAISPYDKSEGSWMRLYLNINAKIDSSWNKYNYIVNYKEKSSDKTSVVKYVDGNFVKVGDAFYKAEGNQMMISVPKVMLDLSGNSIDLGFKWADSTEEYNSIEDFYDKGDTAPYGRFNYQYKAR